MRNRLILCAVVMLADGLFISASWDSLFGDNGRGQRMAEYCVMQGHSETLCRG